MSPSDFENKAVLQLAEGFFTKSLSDAEMDRLADLLDASEKLRDWFGRQHDVDYWLRIIEQEKNRAEKEFVDQPLELSPETMDNLVRLAAMNPSIRREETKNAPAKSYDKATQTTRSRSRTAPLVVALLAFCVVSVGVYIEFFHPTSSSRQTASSFQPIAKVNVSTEIRWADDTEPLKPGQSFETGRLAFSDGLFEIKLRNGVRLALEGDVDVDLLSSEKIFCERGNLSVFVPNGANGFEIETPFANVIDLGTKFFVRIDDTGVETHVVEGRVELSRPLFGKTELESGQAMRVGDQGELRRLKTNVSFYLDDKTVADRNAAAREGAQQRAEQLFARYRKDPSLILDLDLSDSGRTFSNHAETSPNRGSDGILLSGRTSVGSLPDGGALVFSGKNDGIETEVAQAMQNVTLWASVQPESLDRYTQVLFSSRTLGDGSLLWQLTRSGSLNVSLQQKEQDAGQKFVSPPIFKQKHLDVWCQIACVLDGSQRKVVHYVDGRKVSEHAISEALSIRIGEATIGNSFLGRTGTSGDRQNRSFGGRIERFLLFDRALPEAEIQRLSDSLSY